MKNKIGQILTIEQDFVIESAIAGNVIQVKKGDKGFIDSKGLLHYSTGEARGKIQLVKDAEMKGYDHESIATLIYKRLRNAYNLDEIIEDYDLDRDEFIDEIEDILSSIL